MAGDHPASGTVGRSAEVAEGVAFVRQVGRGRGQSLLVEGEPGIGKTHLLDLVAASAGQAGLTVLHAAARELEREVPFAAVVEAIGPDSRKRLAALVPRERELGPEGRFALLEHLLDLLEEMLVRRPAILLIDDLQWADPSTLLFLDRLQRSLGLLPLGVAVAVRPHPRSRELDALLQQLATAGGRIMRLEPLVPEEVASLASAAVGAPVGERLARRLEGAGGNPLYVLEVLRAMQSVITQRGEVADISGDAELPATLYEAIARSLGFLPHETLSLLRAGALLGTSFELDDLSATTGHRIAELVDALSPAKGSGVLRSAESKLEFRHDLVRAALYEAVPEEARSGLHREVARALIQAGRAPSAVASHLLASAQRGDDEAVGWLRQAAADAAHQAPGIAAELLARAVDVAGPQHADRYALEAELAQALVWSGQPEEAGRLARRLLDEQRHGEQRAELARVVLDALFLQGRLAESLAEVEELASDAHLPDAARARVLARAAGAFVQGGDLARGERMAREALRLADSTADDAARSGGLTTLARIDSFRGNAGATLRGVQRAAALVLGGAGQESAMEAVAVTGHLLARYAGRIDDAVQIVGAGVRLAERDGQAWGAWMMHGALGMVLYHAGRLDDSSAALQTALRLADEAGTRMFVPVVLAHLAYVEGLRDERRRAETHLAAALEASRRRSDVNIGTDFDVLWSRGLLDELAGRDAEALDALETLRRQAVARGAHLVGEFVLFGMPQVRVAVRLGDIATAREGAQTVERGAALLRADFPVEPWTSAYTNLCWGMVERDADRLLAAVEALRPTRRPLLIAAACEEAGRALAAADRRPEAVELLAEANDRWASTGAIRKAREIAGELRALGARAPRSGLLARSSSGWQALTPTETRVAELVTEGLTYRETAERLFVSKRTVETHVGHIFAKLNVRSRAELAAFAARRRATDAASPPPTDPYSYG